NEAVITTTFHIEFGASGGDLNICLPYSMIEPVRDLLTRPLQHTYESVDQRWTHQLTRQVRGAEVELSADFATISSTLGELMKMRVGDMLPLNLPEKVLARVDGVPLMECRYGTS